MHGTLRVNVNYLLIQFITYLPCCGYVKYLIKGGKFAQFSYLRIFKVIGEMREVLPVCLSSVDTSS